mmetsp:Transcript_6689/g.8797  ORF Transcript_6689/g.8797 Transcript_6689/m.8797 type:complete len:326 (+) Transcript_6689:217-1194(+)
MNHPCKKREPSTQAPAEIEYNDQSPSQMNSPSAQTQYEAQQEDTPTSQEFTYVYALEEVWIHPSPDTAPSEVSLDQGTVMTLADPHPQYADHPSVQDGTWVRIVDPVDGYICQWNGDGRNTIEECPTYTQSESAAGLPYPWEEQIDHDSNYPFYYNTKTGESTWNVSDVYESTQPQDPEWAILLDPQSGSKYYMNAATGTTQWDTPTKLKQRPRLPSRESYQEQNSMGSQLSNRASVSMSPSLVIDHPNGWEEHKDLHTGVGFYFNPQTRDSKWNSEVKFPVKPKEFDSFLSEADFDVLSDGDESDDFKINDDYSNGIFIKSPLI